MTLKLCLVAASGAGKSTAAKLMTERFAEHGKRAGIYKLALPLYELQSIIYRKAGREIDFFQQDQVLLEELARSLRRIDPQSLVRDFLTRVEAAAEDVILNDDLRDADTDYPVLRAQGFRIVKIVAPEAVRLARLAQRSDLTTTTQTPLDDHIRRITADWELTNDTPHLADYRATVHTFVDQLVEAARW